MPALPTTREEIAARRDQPRLVQMMELGDQVRRRDRVVEGDPPVRVRVHRPVGTDGPLPAVVSLHMGGYILGSYEDDDFPPRPAGAQARLRRRRRRLPAGPRDPVPGAARGLLAALKWTFDHAEELGVDPGRIGILGASAGGGLAAALALLARDRGEVPVAFQSCSYPMLDDRRITTTSGWEAVIWSPVQNELGWSCYLSASGSAPRTCRPTPPRRGAGDLAGLPPAFVSVGEPRPVLRRGRAVRGAAQPRRRAGRAARLPRHAARLRPVHGPRRRLPPLAAGPGGVARRPTRPTLRTPSTRRGRPAAARLGACRSRVTMNRAPSSGCATRSPSTSARAANAPTPRATPASRSSWATVRVQQERQGPQVRRDAGRTRPPTRWSPPWARPEEPVLVPQPGDRPDAVTIQDGPEPFEVAVREVTGDEKARWWDRAVAAYPPYAEYQTRTTRQIPVLVATRRS